MARSADLSKFSVRGIDGLKIKGGKYHHQQLWHISWHYMYSCIALHQHSDTAAARRRGVMSDSEGNSVTKWDIVDQKSTRHPAGACMRKAALPAFVRLLFAFPSDATQRWRLPASSCCRLCSGRRRGRTMRRKSVQGGAGRGRYYNNTHTQTESQIQVSMNTCTPSGCWWL